MYSTDHWTERRVWEDRPGFKRRQIGLLYWKSTKRPGWAWTDWDSRWWRDVPGSGRERIIWRRMHLRWERNDWFSGNVGDLLKRPRVSNDILVGFGGGVGDWVWRGMLIGWGWGWGMGWKLGVWRASFGVWMGGGFGEGYDLWGFHMYCTVWDTVWDWDRWLCI